VTNANGGYVDAQLFVRNLAVQIPELKALLKEHLDDNDEVLPYVFLGAYVWPWFLSLFNSGTDQDLRLCRQYVAALEAELARHNEETTNVIGLEFLRWLVHGQYEPIRAILLPLLREELERMENYDRNRFG
jgi:hypothetical protein